MIINFFVNLVLSASLNLIWSMMNALQIIVHIPLANLAFPSNATAVSRIFLALANFDVLPHPALNALIFDFDETRKAEEVRFDVMGYGDINFILNSGTSFWLINLWAFLAVVSIISAFVKSFGNRFDAFRNWLNSLVFFDLLIRIYLETYLELLVCSLINIKYMSWNYDGERLSSLISVLFFVSLTISPFILHYLVSVNIDKILNKENEKNRY